MDKYFDVYFPSKVCTKFVKLVKMGNVGKKMLE